MTANQLVAYNLRAARELRGMTQEEAARQLEPLLGTLWSKATFSAAETSATSDRKREFSADEIFAFSVVFGVPVAWFFLPPEEGELRKRFAVTAGGDEKVGMPGLLRAVAPPLHPDMRARFSRLGHNADPATDRLADAVEAAVGRAVESALRTTLADPQWSPDAILAALNRKEN